MNTAVDSSTSLGMGGILFIAIFISLGITIALAFIPANIAKKKGYGFGGFYVFGLFLFLIALIVALCLDDKNAQMNQMTRAINSVNNNVNQQQTPSIGDELKKYNDLLAQGAITQEEYNSLKAKLLGANACVCPNCGATVKADSAFCAKCGTKI